MSQSISLPKSVKQYEEEKKQRKLIRLRNVEELFQP